MKLLLIFSLVGFLLLSQNICIAQKQTFDIATYAIPKRWAVQKTESQISYSRVDSGKWAQIIIYKSTVSNGSIDADFDKDWNELVAVNKNITTPEKGVPKKVNNWAVLSGTGTWQYNGANTTSLLTVYSNGNAYISVLCNTIDELYFKNYQILLASLQLNAGTGQMNSSETNNVQTNSSSAATTKISVAGIWVLNEAETRGFSSGHLMYSGGYMRKEYQIKVDGTYIFREKN